MDADGYLEVPKTARGFTLTPPVLARLPIYHLPSLPRGSKNDDVGGPWRQNEPCPMVPELKFLGPAVRDEVHSRVEYLDRQRYLK